MDSKCLNPLQDANIEFTKGAIVAKNNDQKGYESKICVQCQVKPDKEMTNQKVSTVNQVFKVSQDTQCLKLAELPSLKKTFEPKYSNGIEPVTLIDDIYKLMKVPDDKNCAIKSCTLQNQLCKDDLDSKIVTVNDKELKAFVN